MRQSKKKTLALTPEALMKKISKALEKHKKATFYESYGIFMWKAQLIELALRDMLEKKFKYNRDDLEFRTLGWVIFELGRLGLRADLLFLLNNFLQSRNYLAHDVFKDDIVMKSMIGIRGQRFAERALNKAMWCVEEVIQVYDWLNEHNLLSFKKHNYCGKK